MTEILPPADGVAFSKEARDLLIECCVEFITLVSSEANEISEKEAKKTIACDHITKALEQLGFSDYVPAVLEAASEHKEQQKVRLPWPRRVVLTARDFVREPRRRHRSPSHGSLTCYQQGREKKLNKFDQSGMSMEELERLQAEQFAAAAARHN